jgi:hypothetical protein
MSEKYFVTTADMIGGKYLPPILKTTPSSRLAREIPMSSRPDFKCSTRGIFDLRSPPAIFGTLAISSPILADATMDLVGRQKSNPLNTQKPPRFSSTAGAVAFCIEVRCVERCSNAVPLLVWTHGLN